MKPRKTVLLSSFADLQASQKQESRCSVCSCPAAEMQSDIHCYTASVFWKGHILIEIGILDALPCEARRMASVETAQKVENCR